VFKKMYLLTLSVLSFDAFAQEIPKFNSSQNRSEKNEIVLPEFEKDKIIFNRWILQQTTQEFPKDIINVINDFEVRLSSFRFPRFDTSRETDNFQLALETKKDSIFKGKYQITKDEINYVVDQTDALLKKMEENWELRSKYASVCYNIKEIDFDKSIELKKPDRIQIYYNVKIRNDSAYSNEIFIYNFRMTWVKGK
jgi:hypothetical protein